MLLAEPLAALGAEVLGFPGKPEDCLSQALDLEFEPHKLCLNVLPGGDFITERHAAKGRTSDLVQFLSEFILKAHAVTLSRWLSGVKRRLRGRGL
jgi:hypothetical protein